MDKQGVRSSVNASFEEENLSSDNFEKELDEVVFHIQQEIIQKDIRLKLLGKFQ